jgi:hypothetical protein
MTNGTGKQLETISHNIFRKYGRRQVHPPKDKKEKSKPETLDEIKLKLLAELAPETLTAAERLEAKTLDKPANLDAASTKTEILRALHERG